MRTTDPGDAARIELLLAELRLPAIKLVWASLAAQADKEGWPAGRFLAALAQGRGARSANRRCCPGLTGSPDRRRTRDASDPATTAWELPPVTTIMTSRGRQQRTRLFRLRPSAPPHARISESLE